MKDPQRLSTAEETSDLARSLLAVGRARNEPEGARERVWGALAVGFSGGVAAASASGGAAAGANTGVATGAASVTGSASGAGAGVGAGGASVKGAGIALALTKAKLLAIGGVATLAVVSAAVVEKNEPPTIAEVAPAMTPSAVIREKREAPASAQLAKPEPSTEANVEEPARSATSAAPRANALPPQLLGKMPAKDDGFTPVSSLREEAALLHASRAALTRGDLGDARTKLDEARARFPNSQLAPERDALEVRLASESGDPTRAAALARAFVEHYPDSPLRAGIESIASGREK